MFCGGIKHRTDGSWAGRSFFADNLGKYLADTVSNALTCDITHSFITE